ncbi:glycerol-3-phosphate 1-O-acyltransferase PlsY [candidate division WOR-3 bacterium]|jgi:glycerol-3-phosphate acyltransferase PlsY|nr:glycerol-3-phosphate 1-O-acyltransferase PlsY [candidate division WOR-3 bacterium]
MWEALAFIGAYFLGSIPFGFLVGKVKGVNLREKGSGNIGATNVFRVVGKKEGVFVFILDFLKGFLPVIYFSDISVPAGILALLGAIIGHMTTPFLRFKGGKGVATGFGGIVALMPLPALIAFGVWSILVAITRRISVGSLTAALSLPILYFYLSRPMYRSVLYISVLITILVFITHRKNIGRLIRGEEEPIF